MAIHLFPKHETHDIEIESPAVIRRGPKRGQLVTQHAAALRCRTCDQHLQWISHADWALLQEVTHEVSA